MSHQQITYRPIKGLVVPVVLRFLPIKSTANDNWMKFLVQVGTFHEVGDPNLGEMKTIYEFNTAKTHQWDTQLRYIVDCDPDGKLNFGFSPKPLGRL